MWKHFDALYRFALDPIQPTETSKFKIYCSPKPLKCQQWFKKAIAIDEHTVKRAAIADPDLKPL